MKFTVEFIDVQDEYKQCIIIPLLIISWKKGDRSIYFGWLFGTIRIGE